MKKKLKWLTCLCISILLTMNISFKANAETTNPFKSIYTPNDVLLGIMNLKYSQDLKSNTIVYVSEIPNGGSSLCLNKYTSVSYLYQVFTSDTPIDMTDTQGTTTVTNNSNNITYASISTFPVDSCANCTRTPQAYGYAIGSASNLVVKNAGTITKIDRSTAASNFYTFTKGSVKVNGVAKAENFPTTPKVTPKENILNYDWQGDGLKIYNLDSGMNITGYRSTGGDLGTMDLRMFDIEVYGKFEYKGSNTFFTTMAYKKMQTSIQWATCLNYGSKSLKGGEGIGIKEFEWVSDTSHLNTGDIIKFRAVYNTFMSQRGSQAIGIGTTINNGISDIYISDSVQGVNFLNDTTTKDQDENRSGETGNVGDEPGNKPMGDITTPGGTFGSIITIFSSFNGFIGSLFGFLPTEIKILFSGVCILLVGLMVKRAVL